MNFAWLKQMKEIQDETVTFRVCLCVVFMCNCHDFLIKWLLQFFCLFKIKYNGMFWRENREEEQKKQRDKR